MSSIWNQALVHFIDFNGRMACVSLSLQDQSDGVPASLVTLGSAFQGCADARVYAVQLQTTHIFGGAGISGPYPTIWDRANLLYKGVGFKGQTAIIGPKAAIFQANNSTVNLAHPSVVALVDALKATSGNKSGQALTSVYKGVRFEIDPFGPG